MRVLFALFGAVPRAARRAEATARIRHVRAYHGDGDGGGGGPQQRLGNAGAAVVALSLGVGILLASRNGHAAVPPDVAALCAEAHDLAAAAPMSAASKYSRALALLDAHGNGSALQRAELLTLLGDAQHGARQLARARDSYAAASALVARARGVAAAGSPAALELLRKHALLLDRLAAVAADAGDPVATRLGHLDAALDALHEAGGVARLRFDAASGGGRAARQRAADAAGIFYNRAATLLATAAAAMDEGSAVALNVDSAAAHDALAALHLVGAARAGAVADAEEVLRGGGAAAASWASAVGYSAGAAVAAAAAFRGAPPPPPPPSLLLSTDAPHVCGAPAGSCRRVLAEAAAALSAAEASRRTAAALVVALRRHSGAAAHGTASDWTVPAAGRAAGRALADAAVDALPAEVRALVEGWALPVKQAAGSGGHRMTGDDGRREQLAAELQLLVSLSDDAAAQLREALESGDGGRRAACACVG